MLTVLCLAAAATSVLAALLHIYIIVRGASAYRAFGAGERLARLAERGSWRPAVLTSGIAGVFLVFAAYYLAGGGLVPPLPFLKWGMIAIAAVYTLRGGVIVLAAGMAMSPFMVWSSLLSLMIGVLHGVAVWTAWPGLVAP